MGKQSLGLTDRSGALFIWQSVRCLNMIASVLIWRNPNFFFK